MVIGIFRRTDFEEDYRYMAEHISSREIRNTILKGRIPVKQLTFHELQSYLALKYKEGRTSSALFMKLVEEIGEVAEILNQLEGQKETSGDASLEKELVDVIHYAVAIASINHIDLTKAIIKKDKQASIKYNQSPNLEEFLEVNNKEQTLK
ncbi:MazG nucleotide pyrophosphohydrolase domain-containing protein [Paenibacillus aurantius]|uniref:MazG nucleotide pyrophosphohydrolase domain-containing protein n=1 Tax=Paenibacillus aurantius TaxID=2918900 RepID=A0AA96LIF7_9BACL|nr:MazG nucleotide pyrophosphohydrolase domain-containing protein [Paenibacillus aurantius]WNQ13909.1 MazG nucleotide pyrophosphohydrolase domain-containing protein [Paenibacillus aurantius]